MASFSCGFNYSDDDEVILDTPESSTGSEAEVILLGKIDMRIIKKEMVPDWETELDVSVELMGSAAVGEDNGRLGVDVVLIVDVSSSMMGNKSRGYLKSTIEFFIRKLNPTDRLSVVRFSNSADRLCPLRSMTKDAQADIQKLIDCLEVGIEGGANLAAGLGEALRVLKDRSYFNGRNSALIILSSIEATNDAAEVPLGDVPVHAFAIGSDFAYDVLKQIASRSKGGTFSILDFETTDSLSNLSHMFSQCLARLLAVVVQDLNLTITPLKDKYKSENEFDEVEIESTIKKVDAKYHPQSISVDTGSITVSLGHLYRQERRELSVKLLLPEVDAEVETKVVQLKLSYSDGEEPYDAVPIVVKVMRICRFRVVNTLVAPVPVMHARNIEDAVQTFEANKYKFKSIHDIDKNAKNESIHDIEKNANKETIHNIEKNASNITEIVKNETIHNIGKKTI